LADVRNKDSKSDIKPAAAAASVTVPLPNDTAPVFTDSKSAFPFKTRKKLQRMFINVNF